MLDTPLCLPLVFFLSKDVRQGFANTAHGSNPVCYLFLRIKFYRNKEQLSIPILSVATGLRQRQSSSHNRDLKYLLFGPLQKKCTNPHCRVMKKRVIFEFMAPTNIWAALYGLSRLTMLLCNGYYYPPITDEVIANFPMALRTLTGVGRPWPPKREGRCPEGHCESSRGGESSQDAVTVACLFQPPRCGHCHRIGKEAILLTFRSFFIWPWPGWFYTHSPSTSLFSSSEQY